MKKKRLLSLIFVLFFGGLLIFSGIKIVLWKIDSDNTNAEISDLQDKTPVEEKTDDESTEIVSSDEPPLDYGLYWKFLNTPFLSVNLSDLKAENSDTVGWLKVEGTNVNYPFVQASDNKYYLTHSFSKNYNSAGWVFLDYINSPALTDKNSIIYAHGRTDKTMFGSLHNLLGDSWRANSNNFLIRTVTASSSNVYQIFSVYVIPETSDYLKTSFASDDGFKNFAETLKSRSNFDFNTSVSGGDRILTLSTCYDDYSRIVVHAKLIKYSNN